MSKRDAQRRINTRPEGVGQAASTLITASQVIGGQPNTVGGWVFGPSSISKSGIVLHSGGWIQLGIDDHTIRLDAQDASYRMWAGAELGADAPFSISVEGNLHAENAYIEGEIVAETGEIGGWTIGATALTGGDASLDSSGVLTLGTGTDLVVVSSADVLYRLWAGAVAGADAPFSVTKAGLLVADGATIEGALTATTGALVDLDVTGSLILSGLGLIKSTGYAAGVSGWQIEQDGSAEFQDVLVRGTLHSVVFQANTVSTVAGSLRVEPDPISTVLTTQLVVPAVAGTTSLEVVLVYPIWEVNDEVMLVDEDNAIQGTLVVQAILASGSLVTYLVRNDGGATPADTFQVGSLVYKIGTEPGYLLITANPILKGPRYAVVDSAGGVDTLVGVFGNLDGAFGVATKQYGFGVGDYANGNYMLYGPTAGFKVLAGDGRIQVNENGIAMEGGDNVYEARSALRWMSPNVPANKILEMYAFQQDYGGGIIDDFSYITTGNEHGGSATLGVSSVALTGKVASASLETRSGSEYAIVAASSDDTRSDGDRTFLALDADKITLQSWGSPYTTEAKIIGNLTVTGDYKNYRNATTYTGYLFVPLTTPATSTAFDGDLYDVDNDEAVIDLSASFGLPAGIKAVSLGLWSTCATVGKEFSLRRAAGGLPAVAVYTQVANQQNFCAGIVPCDANGDIYFTTTAVHGAECAVYIRINGYWI